MSNKKVDKIIVRMYKIGTGDCFVLKFLSKDTVTFKMMIDCGSCRGNKNVFNSFLGEIKTFVDGKIDLLVITHEHQDHIIGFARGKDVLDKIEFGNVWVAWTEDPTNEFAKKLRDQYKKKVRALANANLKMKKLTDKKHHLSTTETNYEALSIQESNSSFMNSLAELSELNYDTNGAEFAASGKKTQMEEAMEYIMEHIPSKSGEPPFFCYPGKPVPSLPGTEGINFYVLGPPENESLLKKDEIEGDVYDRKHHFSENLDFDVALNMNKDQLADIAPFTNEYFLDSKDVNNYKKSFLKGKDNDWRNIDFEWLTSAGSLAIRLEKFMNNLCLVLAIEFDDSGRVLLFPGDAQSGNWKSWHDEKLKWEVKDDCETKEIRAKDLLNRTVLYKVGHHFSHNGTASKSGLDLMVSDDLIALAPLDYNNIHSGWKNTMPATGLMEELIKRTKGRVFRIDEGLINDSEAVEARNNMSTKQKNNFIENKDYKVTEKYIELIIKNDKTE
jgi:beta-lactamase superfamily II metal-dependent hydrolase